MDLNGNIVKDEVLESAPTLVLNYEADDEVPRGIMSSA